MHGVRELARGHGQGSEIRDEIVSGVRPVQKIKELDEGFNGSAFSPPKVAAHAQVNLGIRSAAELIERGLHPIHNRSVVRVKPIIIQVFRSCEGVRARALKLGKSDQFDLAGKRKVPASTKRCRTSSPDGP